MIPTLTTDRLTLRAPELRDFNAYAAFRASDRARFVGGPNTRSEAWQQFCALAGQWQIRGYGRWIVADTATDAALGVVGLFHPDEWPECEIAWSVFGAGEGRGIAHEAALAARRFAYDTLGFTTLMSCVDPANARSLTLARRLGCRPDGQFESSNFGTMTVHRHPSPSELVA